MTNIRNRHKNQKKRIVPDGVDLVATHPLADKIKKAEFMARMEGTAYSPVNRINMMRSDLRTISSQIYTAMQTNYWDLGGICETEAELDQHLDWLFEQIEFYAGKTKDLLRQHRKELSARRKSTHALAKRLRDKDEQ